MLSRNFRLQKVGDIRWLEKNYNFSDVAFHIDELIVLDVSRGVRSQPAFCDVLSRIAAGCFAPISAGGGIRDPLYARALLRAGADKVVVNSALVDATEIVQAISEEFGQQCVIGAVDVKKDLEGGYSFYTQNGNVRSDTPVLEHLQSLNAGHVGELYLNSIDRDGTGQGFDFNALKLLPAGCSLPVILAGGVGNYRHLHEGLLDERVDAVATAHLFNFVGDGLCKARAALSAEDVCLATWPERGSAKLLASAER